MVIDHMKVRKGWEFPVVALAGVGYMPALWGGREGCGAGVLCGCDVGYAAVGN